MCVVTLRGSVKGGINVRTVKEGEKEMKAREMQNKGINEGISA